MLKVLVTSLLLVVSLPAMASLVCSSGDLLYTENIRGFGIPHVPVGTPLGFKRLIYDGKIVAQKQFKVTDPADWSHYEDWECKTELSNKIPIWQNPTNRYEKVFFAAIEVVCYREVGVSAYKQDRVLCREDITPVP